MTFYYTTFLNTPFTLKKLFTYPMHLAIGDWDRYTLNAAGVNAG